MLFRSTYYSIDGEKTKTSVFEYKNNKISGQFNTGEDMNSDVKEMEFGYIFTKNDGSYMVTQKYFDGVFARTVKNEKGIIIDDNTYAIFSDDKINKYIYGEKEPYEIDKFEIADYNTFMFEEIKQDIIFTENGFIVVDRDTK